MLLLGEDDSQQERPVRVFRSARQNAGEDQLLLLTSANPVPAVAGLLFADLRGAERINAGE